MSKYLDRRTDDGEPPVLRRSGIDCAEASDLIPALALGVIETGERHAVRLHCQTCPVCAAALEASQRVADFLPFAGMSLAPPDRAKHALFARIADAGSASAVSPTAFTTVAHIDAPVIDSPADKRRPRAAAHVAHQSAGDLRGTSWPLSVLSSGVGRLATGSLALALVLVTIYSLQTFDLIGDNAVSTPPASASDTEHDTSVAQADGAAPMITSTAETAAATEAPDEGNSNVPLGTLLTFDTQGASATEPVLQQLSTDAARTYVYKTVSSGSQTELMRSVAPTFADCALTITDTGTYQVTVSGVNLPGNRHQAFVYLVTYTGERVNLGRIHLNEFGDGSTTFAIEQPLSNFRTLQIGSGLHAPGAVSFSLNSSDSTRGLSAST